MYYDNSHLIENNHLIFHINDYKAHLSSLPSQFDKLVSIGLIIIIIISIFKEDYVFSIAASLPYGPPVNTDIDYYRTFFRTCLFLQVLRG